MSKSIKFFLWVYIVGCLIGIIAFLSGLRIFYPNPNFATGMLQAVIMLVISLPLLVIGLLGSLISLWRKKYKGEVTVMDSAVVKCLVLVSILIAVTQLIGDSNGWW